MYRSVGHWMHTKFARGLSANGVVQLCQLAIRILEVPIMLAAWGAARYGEWLMIAAVPTLFAVCDGGITKAATREMALLMGKHDRIGALAVLRTAWAALVAISVALVGLLAITACVFPAARHLGLTEIGDVELQYALPSLAVQTFVSFLVWLLAGALASIGRYATGTLCIAFLQGATFAGLVLGVLFSSQVHVAALTAMVGSSLGLVVTMRVVKNHFPGEAFDLGGACPKVFRRLLVPSLANLSFPIGESLNIQGMRLLIGATLGPTSLVVFSTLRTLCRIAVQPITAVARTLEPELSMAHGDGNRGRLVNLMVVGTQLTAVLSIASSLALVMFGPWIYAVWTRHEVEFLRAPFYLLLVTSIVAAVCSTPMAVVVSSNRHFKLAIAYALIYGVLSLAAASLISRAFGVTGIAAVLLMAEFVVGAVAIRSALDMLRHSSGDFLGLLKKRGVLKRQRAHPHA